MSDVGNIFDDELDRHRSYDCLEAVMTNYFAAKLTARKNRMDTFDWKSNHGPIQYGSFVDVRDGQKYKCFKIGGQIWMAENLRYEDGWAGCTINDFWNVENFDKGVIGPMKYTWSAAMNIPSCMNKMALTTADKKITEGRIDHGTYVYDYQGLAPLDWRIPSINDFKELHDTMVKEFGKDAPQKMYSLFVDETCESSVQKIWTVNEYSSDGAYAQQINLLDWENWELCSRVENKSELFVIRCVMDVDA